MHEARRTCPEHDHPHVLSRITVNQCVSVHECTEEAAAEIDGIRSADILDDAIENVQCWEFAGRRGLDIMELLALVKYINK